MKSKVLYLQNGHSARSTVKLCEDASATGCYNDTRKEVRTNVNSDTNPSVMRSGDKEEYNAPCKKLKSEANWIFTVSLTDKNSVFGLSPRFYVK